MNMATTTTVQRDDAAECRQKFEEWRDRMKLFNRAEMHAASVAWQAAWKAARGE
jgi:hypothetical protein